MSKKIFLLQGSDMLIGALDPVLHYRNLQKSNICFLQNVGATRPSELLVDRCSRYKRKAMWKGICFVREVNDNVRLAVVNPIV